jgi:hypothetical protein
MLKSPFYLTQIYRFFLGLKINLIPVRSSLSIEIYVNPGTQTKSTPLGATNPLAIATALIA